MTGGTFIIGNNEGHLIRKGMLFTDHEHVVFFVKYIEIPKL